MRFLWQTIPLMGITFFFAILWRRANRYGAFAAFFASVAAVLLCQYIGWNGDAGLPKTVTLLLGFGILAGVVVSLLTPPEPKRLLDSFYLLLKTPIGQEDVLRKAGFTEIPGSGTFEPPAETPNEANYISEIEAGIDKRQSRKESIYGFAIMTIIVVALLVGVKLLAWWLAKG